jgi:eukaryotic-like serine/threonine-protein kinase
MADYLGQRLGNYRLIRLLGKGGFAEVYLGEHAHLKTLAAVKVLHAQVAEEEISHFTREAQIIANLKHPHIVRVLDFGVERALPFLVMDFASQGSLRRAYPKGSRPLLDECVRYVKQIAAAL